MTIVHMGPLVERINRVEFGLLRMYHLRAVATRMLGRGTRWIKPKGNP